MVVQVIYVISRLQQVLGQTADAWTMVVTHVAISAARCLSTNLQWRIQVFLPAGACRVQFATASCSSAPKQRNDSKKNSSPKLVHSLTETLLYKDMY